MDFTDILIHEFNKISDTPIDRSKYETPDEVIALFMNSSKQRHHVRIKYLSKAYEEGLKDLSEAAESGVDSYDDNITPVMRAIDFAMNELLVEMEGDAPKCLNYVNDILGSVPDAFQDVMSVRVKYAKQDNLSRILEGQDMCAALVISDQKVEITTNAIRSGKRGGVVPGPYNTYLNRVMSYLVNGESAEVTRESIFLEVCNQRLAQEAKKGLSLPSEVSSYIAKELMNDHHAWRDRSPNQTMELLRNSGIKSPLIRHKVLSAYSILDRTAHDFKKVEEEFRDRNFRYEILAKDGDGKHAEMKMIDHMLEDVLFKGGGLPKTYISISKLCCADCQSSIEALNSAVKNLHKIDNFISYGSTSSRDGHGQKFDAWQKPRFLEGEISAYDGKPEVKKICEEARKLYSPAVKKDGKDWQDMYATASESETEEDAISHERPSTKTGPQATNPLKSATHDRKQT